jgi:hypothetical protein
MRDAPIFEIFTQEVERRGGTLQCVVRWSFARVGDGECAWSSRRGRRGNILWRKTVLERIEYVLPGWKAVSGQAVLGRAGRSRRCERSRRKLCAGRR